MRLDEITLEVCLNMAKNLAEVANENEQSTWYYDPAMHRNAKYFAIIRKEAPIGFVVLKKGGFGEWLLWISLDPLYRRGTSGALAAYLSLSYAFDNLEAKYILSDVFQSNQHSTKIHERLFSPHDNKRVINGEKVNTFIMTRAKYEQNKADFASIVRKK